MEELNKLEGYKIDWKVLNTKDYGIPQNRERVFIIGKMINNISKGSVFIDFGFKKHNYPNSHLYSPCINAKNRLWCVPMSRYSSCVEQLMLQGFPKNFKQVVSNTQLKNK